MSSINRTCHALRREKTISIPRHIIFFDTETTMTELPGGDVEHSLLLGWACYYRRGDHSRKEKLEWLFFTDTKTFWRFVLDHCPTKNKTWIIAHNIGFDFTVCEGFKHLTKAKFKIKFFHSKAMTTVIKVTTKGKSLVFVDSCNWFDMSLEKLGNLIGIPKLTIDFDTADFTYTKTYCKRDVEILIGAFKSLAKFLQGNRISRLCYTRASTAMAAYLLKHLDFPIYIHNNREAINLERDSYFGGRTECFYIGELNHGPYYIVDVNSLYPFVMQYGDYPVKYEKILNRIPMETACQYLEKFAVVARCLVETTEAVYPVRGDRTIFPVGTFWTVLTTPEIKHALDRDRIREISDMVVYKQAPIFRTFVERFYQLRQDFASAGVTIYEQYTKIFLNSLYGKFGQKGEIWKHVGPAPGEPDRIEECIEAGTGRRTRLRYLLGEVYELTGYEETRHSFPAIAAHVTAYARLHLWSLIQIAGKHNYYYCDTDSLVINQDGLNNLNSHIDAARLGALKVENCVQNMTIYGLKDYQAGGKKVLKGIRQNALKISDVEYEQEQWPSLQGLLTRAQTEKYITIKQTKNLYREYTKGVKTLDGWTIPFLFDGDSPRSEPLPELPF
ncbi:hypothetical protein LCGC14_1176870 [marine sediment metagenome]|uniref:DNA-directed DNA polymerase n=1 Tax=marine sediment metagenome TaxID=412755 RepID=A0A0F9PTN7_9ZZZZ